MLFYSQLIGNAHASNAHFYTLVGRRKISPYNAWRLIQWHAINLRAKPTANRVRLSLIGARYVERMWIKILRASR